MPSANALFQNDPIAFLQNNAIVSHAPESHIYGLLYETDPRKRGLGNTLNAFPDNGSIEYDLVGVANQTYILRRVLPDSAFTAQGLPAPRAAEDSIRGLFFPYKTGGVSDIVDMGTVIFQTDTPPTLAFTGAMNGCAFVATDTQPPSPAKIQLYHYQSPESNPLYAPSGSRNFPTPMRCWIPESEYMPADWSRRFTQNGNLTSTFIFVWRNQRTGEVRVIAQTMAFDHLRADRAPVYNSRLVRSWQIQGSDAAARAYTSHDPQTHLSS